MTAPGDLVVAHMEVHVVTTSRTRAKARGTNQENPWVVKLCYTEKFLVRPISWCRLADPILKARAMPPNGADERRRLLNQGRPNIGFVANHNADPTAESDDDEDVETIDFEKNDKENPKNWSLKWKYTAVFMVFIIGLNCPMSSSIFAPAIADIAESFKTSSLAVTGAQSGFVCMLGVGPLFFAPMSETFGRRPVFLINLTLFTLMQIPSALAPNVESFIVFRTLAGLFASVGVANGGGTISDMFETHERATVLGFYLLGPLLGPTLGPFLGGMILSALNWRWILWFQLTLASVVLIAAYFFLPETRAVIILEKRKQKLEKENEGKRFKVEGQSDMGIVQKIAGVSLYHEYSSKGIFFLTR